MTIGDVVTTHDLADLLEETAKALRALPAMSLDQEETVSKGIKEATELDRGNKSADVDTALAATLPELGREQAQNELQSLTVDGIRSTAAALGIRVPSKSKKSDAIALVLAHMFDVPAGQELLRTFHKRNADGQNQPSRIRQQTHGSGRSEVKK